MSRDHAPSSGRAELRAGIALRRALQADVAAIADLHVASFQAAYKELLPPNSLDRLNVEMWTEIWEKRFRALDRQGRKIAIAEIDRHVVGFIHFGPSSDEDAGEPLPGHIYSLYTMPSMTGRGVGTALVHHAVADMYSVGHRHATLWVIAKNVVSREFYEWLGWKLDGAQRSESLGPEGEPGTGHEVDTVRYHRCLGESS